MNEMKTLARKFTDMVMDTYADNMGCECGSVVFDSGFKKDLEAGLAKMIPDHVAELEGRLVQSMEKIQELQGQQRLPFQEGGAARTFTIAGNLTRMAREGHVFGVDGVGELHGRHCIGLTTPTLAGKKLLCRWIALQGGSDADRQAIEFFRLDEKAVVATVRQGRADVLPVLIRIQKASELAPEPLHLVEVAHEV